MLNLRVERRTFRLSDDCADHCASPAYLTFLIIAQNFHSVKSQRWNLSPQPIAYRAIAPPIELLRHEEPPERFELSSLVYETSTSPVMFWRHSGTGEARTRTPLRMDGLANHSDTITAPFQFIAAQMASSAYPVDWLLSSFTPAAN